MDVSGTLSVAAMSNRTRREDHGLRMTRPFDERDTRVNAAGYVRRFPAPEPTAGVGRHHSTPRAVSTYSGHRRSIGGAKSFGSNGATHLLPPTPPPVRSRN